MKCNICGKKKATVHLTEIIDEQVTEMHICEDCAKEKSVQMEQQFGLADLLAGLSDFGKPTQQEKKAKLECANCSTSYEDFRKFGRLGCSECYEAFRAHLATLLKKIHGSNRHLGKIPKQVQSQEAPKKGNSLEDLKEQLHYVIDVEDFEKAAELRDKIREMETEGTE